MKARMDRAFVKPFISQMKPLPTGLPPTGALRSQVRCLLCDIYGTLFISGSGDISIARRKQKQFKDIDKLLARYHLDMPPSALIESLYRSIQDEHRQAKTKGVGHPEVQIDKIWNDILPLKELEMVRRFAVEFEMIMNPVWPMPGLKALIHACRKGDVRLGIISNAQFYTPYLFKWYLGKDLQTLGFDPQLTFFSYQYGRAKPSRYLFQLAVEKLENIEVSMDQVAYIGNDRRNDVAPAQDAGFQTILFAGDARSLRMRDDDPTCNHVHPDLRITHLDQLTSYFKKVRF
jgi:putative hydrolase of the HAD superfamily